MTSLAFSVDQYKQALTNQQQSVRDHVFEALLRETPVRESASSRRRLREFGQCFLDFPERYQLALIVLPDEEEENQLEYLSLRQVALLELIRTQLTPAPYVFSGGHHVVAVLGARSDGDWAQELAALRRTALETQRLHLMIALSDEGHGCEQLHALYQSVQGIIHCASQMDGQLLDVWQRGNFPDQPRKVPLDYAEMSQLHTLLLHAEKTGALSLLHTVYEGTRAATFLDEVMNRQVYYNIRSVILRVKAERYEELSSLEIPDYHGDLSENELIEQLSACCKRVCDLPNERAAILRSFVQRAVMLLHFRHSVLLGAANFCIHSTLHAFGFVFAVELFTLGGVALKFFAIFDAFRKFVIIVACSIAFMFAVDFLSFLRITNDLFAIFNALGKGPARCGILRVNTAGIHSTLHALGFVLAVELFTLFRISFKALAVFDTFRK